MLLIGMPKSASTSLMHAIGKLGNLKIKNGQGGRRGDEKCDGFVEIQKYHGTTVKRTEEYLLNWMCNRETIYKEHILPTPEHLGFLKKTNGSLVVKCVRYFISVSRDEA